MRRAMTFLAFVSMTLGAPALTNAAQPDASEPSEPAGEPLPTLDELLGIESDETDAPAPDAPSVLEDQTAEALEPGEIGEALDQAAALMDRAASRLADAEDPGIATQRLQEDAIRKLDLIILAAQQQNQNQSGSPSPSPSTSEQQQPNQPQSQQQQQSQPSPSDSQGEASLPGAVDPSLRPGQAATGAAWGALPERLREALTQGLADRYSSIYERATEQYYRRLAEEERP